MRNRLLGISRLRRSLIYQPLAAFLAILLVPSLSWFESRAGVRLGPPARTFQSAAQIVVQGCTTGHGNAIIQNYCDPSGNSYGGDLTQLESDAVAAYLTMHGLPATEAQTIYNEGDPICETRFAPP